jgi:CheY-like chemotaxis protein
MVKKILIIDDAKLNRELLKAVLGGGGYGVSLACDGQEGIEKLQNEKFDLVILDLILPGMDGFAVLNLIKSEQKTKYIPVLVLTGRDSKEEYSEVMRMGAADCFVKYKMPHAQLLEYIKSILG